jgi:hypothetical protein
LPINVDYDYDELGKQEEMTTRKLLALVERRFACIGNGFCDGKVPHARGCPAAYQYRALKLAETVAAEALATRRKAAK